MTSIPPSWYHRGCLTCELPTKKNPYPQHVPTWISNPKVSDPKRSRTFVLCFDGTGDSPDETDSNVLQFVATLKDPEDRNEQIVYYQPGIGTSTDNEWKPWIHDAATKFLDKVYAYSLDKHIKEGYKFLMEHYQAGDKICLFGFSRGAYTARALAGMLQKIGLLRESQFTQLDSAFAAYEKDDKDSLSKSAEFKMASIDVKVGFLGVWDTVESVGNEKSLPFSRSSDTVEIFRHALSLDEHRVKFPPSYCTPEVPKDKQTGPVTDVKEVFFAGVHCDVGGGSVKNGTRHTLARIPLRWMIRECFIEQTGIIFDERMINQVGLDINSIYKAPEALSSAGHRLPVPERFTWTTPIRGLWNMMPQIFTPPPRPKWVFKGEAQEELEDALSPIYDQLAMHLYWAPVEWIYRPAKKHSDNEDPEDGREVYPPDIVRRMLVHRSVKARLGAIPAEGEKELYQPRIRRRIEDEEPRLLKREEWLAEQHFEWVD